MKRTKKGGDRHSHKSHKSNNLRKNNKKTLKRVGLAFAGVTGLAGVLGFGPKVKGHFDTKKYINELKSTTKTDDEKKEIINNMPADMLIKVLDELYKNQNDQEALNDELLIYANNILDSKHTKLDNDVKHAIQVARQTQTPTPAKQQQQQAQPAKQQTQPAPSGRLPKKIANTNKSRKEKKAENETKETLLKDAQAEKRPPPALQPLGRSQKQKTQSPTPAPPQRQVLRPLSKPSKKTIKKNIRINTGAKAEARKEDTSDMLPNLTYLG